MFVNPVENASNAFLIMWEHIPMPVRSLFYIGLALAVIWALYRLLSR